MTFHHPLNPLFSHKKATIGTSDFFHFYLFDCAAASIRLFSLSLQLFTLTIKMTFYFMLVVNHCIFRCFFHAAVKCERASFMKRTA